MNNANLDESTFGAYAGQIYEKITSSPVIMWTVIGVAALVVILAGVSVFLAVKRKKKSGKNANNKKRLDKNPSGKPGNNPANGAIGKLHSIGNRQDQQDSFSIQAIGGGLFAVVADGMGGLSEGDKVSQLVVMTMLQAANKLQSLPKEQVLFEMVAYANSEVNRMLGHSEYYKSGSTVVAAIVERDCFHWISVGDSRIYLYRNKRLIQLNREHTYESELMLQAVNGEIPFEEVTSSKERCGLTSFIGMGELKYVDGSRRGIKKQQGDCLLLMTDGVFNTVSEEEICQIIETAGSAQNAADMLHGRIQSYRKEKQDNYTAIIIDL